jgi:hypothetical protein
MSIAKEVNKMPKAITSPPMVATNRVDFRRHIAITIEDENNDIAHDAEPIQPM